MSIVIVVNGFSGEPRVFGREPVKSVHGVHEAEVHEFFFAVDDREDAFAEAKGRKKDNKQHLFPEDMREVGVIGKRGKGGLSGLRRAPADDGKKEEHHPAHRTAEGIKDARICQKPDSGRGKKDTEAFGKAVSGGKESAEKVCRQREGCPSVDIKKSPPGKEVCVILL